MDGMMQKIMWLLASLAGLYSLLIMIRIILTWFSTTQQSALGAFLSRITDPYLNWWRRRLNLRIGVLDFSVVVALAVLSIFQTFCSKIAMFGRISPGTVLLICLSALWSAVSFILGFFLLVLILRFFAFIAHSDIYSPFWNIVNTISQPILYRINRILFGKRIVRFATGIIVSILVLAALMAGGHIALKFLSGLLRLI
jgi:YggT family protein